MQDAFFPSAFFSRRGAIPFVPERWFYTLIVFIVLTVFPGQGKAQGENELSALLARLETVELGGRKLVKVSLKDALAIALERSNMLEASRKGEQIARSAMTAALDINSPSLTTSFSQGRTLTPLSSAFSGVNWLSVSRTDYSVMSTEYSKKMNNGIRYGVKLSETTSSYDRVDIAAEGDTPVPDTASSGAALHSGALVASLNIPLFQDFGSSLGEVPYRISQAGYERSQWNTRKNGLDLLRQISFIYWDLVGLLERTRVAEESVKLSEQMLSDNRTRLEAGVIQSSEVKVAESQVAMDQLMLLGLKQEALRIEDQVRAVMNLEGLEMGILPAESPRKHDKKYAAGEMMQKMMAFHPELKNMEAILKMNTYEMVSVKNKDRTNLDLSFQYTLNSYNSGTAVTGVGNSDLAGRALTLTWTLPLFDRSAGEKIRQKELERAQLQLKLKDTRSTLKVRLQSALRSLKLTAREVKTAQVSGSLQQELLENEIERQKLGLSTSFQVSQIQQQASMAQQVEILARVKQEKAHMELLLLTGDVFPFFGLTLPENQAGAKR